MVPGDENSKISVSQYLRELKSNISAWEDIVIKSQKLNMNLKGAGQSVTNIADSVSQLCGTGRARFSGLDKVAQLISEVTVIERYISEKMSSMNRAMQHDLTDNLSRQIETWRRSVANIKRERDIDGRKAKIEYKKSFAELTKLEKKVNSQSGRKQSLSNTLSLQLEYASQDLQNKERFVEELERCVLRKAICEERGRYQHLVESLRPVLEAQLSMRDDLDRLQLIYDQLYSGPFEDLGAVPPDVEAYVRQYHVSEQSRASSFSSVYSRANSQLSLAGNNAFSSVDDCVYQTGGLSLHCQDHVDISSSSMHDQRSSDQASSALRYSNLRQLKHTCDKKYARPPSCLDNSGLSHDQLPPYDGDGSRSRHSHYDVTHTVDHPLPPDLPQSHYDDSTLTRPHTEPNKDHGKDIPSGTSTFRRHKPSNITPMEAPSIMNTRFYQAPSSEDRKQWSETATRPLRVTSTLRDVSDTRLDVDGHANDRNSCHSNFWNDVANESLTTRGPPVRMDVAPTYADGRRSVDQLHFKQQLLQVVQAGHASYEKPLSASHFF